MSNLFKGYISAGDKEFVSLTQHQKYKYDYWDNTYKDKLMMLALNKYKNLCTKDKWLAKSHEEQRITALSAELDNIKYTNIKLAKFYKC